ncbi:MAG: TIGR00730 family Rossman fold protein [Chloroflexi bacterium]|nr:TIGR00730 family Rossman fold protein [Chloroflexota bacterium]
MTIHEYEINKLAKEESWRMFRIIGELVEGFDSLTGIEPAVSIYGSARLKEGDPLWKETEDIAYRLGKHGFNIITGGGPGIMAAANCGASRAGVASIGLNIELPEEQVANPYTTKSITFHHFFVRKVMLVKYATAFIIMPGGLGTLDELTEVLTLIQTGKTKPFPVLLFGSEFWKGFLDWMEDIILPRDFISVEDLHLLRVFDKSEDVIDAVHAWHEEQKVIGKHLFREHVQPSSKPKAKGKR